MTGKLPTLKGLRAFEKVFDLGGFAAAARKLNVQQPAISYQIKRLEEDLGVALFSKEKGRLVPTPAAHELFQTLTESFGAIRKTADKLRQDAKGAPLTIATYPGIGTYWLSSRLPELAKQLSVPVKVVTLVRDADILREHADCQILFGTGEWIGREARMLLPEIVCPVAAPDLAESLTGGADGASTSTTALITQDDPERRWISWEDWQVQTGEPAQWSDERIVVNDHGFALHLALSGAGISLAWMGVVKGLLSAGSLVPLSDKVATSDAGYWLVAKPGFFETEDGKQLLETLSGES